MAKYRVYLETGASGTVIVEVPDDLDEHEAKEQAIEKAFEVMPSSVCAQCSGWDQKWSFDHGGWDVMRESDGSDVAPELVED